MVPISEAERVLGAKMAEAHTYTEEVKHEASKAVEGAERSKEALREEGLHQWEVRELAMDRERAEQARLFKAAESRNAEMAVREKAMSCVSCGLVLLQL